MERHLDTELQRLNTELLRMATLTETAIVKSIEALRLQDKKLATEVIDSDIQINALENVIEEIAIEMLALFQPMARDLRFITTGMKVNAELERIADLAANVSYRTREISDEKTTLAPMDDLMDLSNIARTMVKQTIDSFVNRDEAMALKVIASDDDSNTLRNKIMEDLIKDHMEKDPTSASQAVSLLLAARDLERICDHATNIAEDVIYMVQAKVVKHHPERLLED
ncbi:MAG: phosphate transport system protein [Lysobacterales bacterium]|jgi:phosphate transport system protein